MERYDPDADEWNKVADMTTRRSGAGVGVIDGLLYAVGGHDGPTVRKSAEVFINTLINICITVKTTKVEYLRFNYLECSFSEF